MMPPSIYLEALARRSLTSLVQAGGVRASYLPTTTTAGVARGRLSTSTTPARRRPLEPAGSRHGAAVLGGGGDGVRHWRRGPRRGLLGSSLGTVAVAGVRARSMTTGTVDGGVTKPRRKAAPGAVRKSGSKAGKAPSLLPQGPLDSADLPPEVLPSYPTVIEQARRNMRRFDNCVLLTRVGGFYELYFDQAEEVAPLLNLKVGQKRTSLGPVPMAGFPFFQLDRFLKMLVQDLSRYVAVAEEFPNDDKVRARAGGLMHDRRVTRVITPGTLIDEAFMDPYANNYVMAVALGGDDDDARPGATSASADAPLGLAWLDLSTGQFYTQAATLAALPAVLARVGPREVVLDRAMQPGPDGRDGDGDDDRRGILAVLSEERHLIAYAPASGEGGRAGDGSVASPMSGPADWAPMLESAVSPEAAAAFSADEVRAGSMVLAYVRDRLQGLSTRLLPPQRYEAMRVMSLDRNSMRALEIRQTMRDGYFRGSLLHSVRRTATKSGARLLADWLCSPSTSLDVIAFRQDLVEAFVADPDLRDTVVALLKRCHDSQRLAQKFALGRGTADDLLALAATARATQQVEGVLRRAAAAGEQRQSHHKGCLATLADRVDLAGPPMALAARIQDAIDEDGLVQRHALEDGEASDLMALARDVAEDDEGGGSSETSAAGGALLLPLQAKKTGTQKDHAPQKHQQQRPKRRPSAASIRDLYAADSEAWVMRPGASPMLSTLHARLAALKQEASTLQASLRTRLSAPSLTLKWTPGAGHVCHVKGQRDVAAASAATAGPTVSASRSTRTFHHAEWTALGQRVEACRAGIRADEGRVFAALREDVVRNLARLRRAAAGLAVLDVTSGWAALAEERDLVRPVLDESRRTLVLKGRHPTVEAGLLQAHANAADGGGNSGAVATAPSRSFVHNDCRLGGPGAGLAWLITGPNMAGKSTFLRQNALITVLAQAGCFVPCAHASLGVVDALYTRVGAADDVARDRSTFMVEMLETAAILRGATDRSLVVMDEVGRGTSPADGAAVAFACLWHLATVNRCRTLFATHFYDVADRARDAGLLRDGGEDGDNNARDPAPVVEAYCTDVAEDPATGAWSFVHRLRPGVNRQSHALKVARLAGLPEEALDVARQIMVEQEGGNGRRIGSVAGADMAARTTPPTFNGNATDGTVHAAQAV